MLSPICHRNHLTPTEQLLHNLFHYNCYTNAGISHIS